MLRVVFVLVCVTSSIRHLQMPYAKGLELGLRLVLVLLFIIVCVGVKVRVCFELGLR